MCPGAAVSGSRRPGAVLLLLLVSCAPPGLAQSQVMSILSGTGQVTSADLPAPEPLVVYLRDAAGRPVENAIVDWVVVELRSDNSISTPIATHAALLQRDGDVVSVNGVSAVRFLTVAPGQYHVAVRHRNHLGVMTAEVLNLTNIATLVDFSNPAMQLYGTNACDNNGTIRSLWSGDSNRDKQVKFQGSGSDVDVLFFQVLLAPGNTALYLNFISQGYAQTDFNMDGLSIYVGPSNDRAFVYWQIIISCQSANCILEEQIP